jgi:predicted RND superfamily exporter protein
MFLARLRRVFGLVGLARPRLALLALGLVAVVLLYVALRFASYDTAPDTVVDPGTSAFQHEVDYESVFGADPLVVLVSGNVEKLFNGAGLTPLIAIEGRLAQHGDLGVQSVYGPASIATVAGATIQNVAAGQLTAVMTAAQNKAIADAQAAGKSAADQQTAGQQAAQAAGAAYIQSALKQYPELQQLAPLQANNPKWMNALFVNPDNGKPKARFAAVTPDADHVVVTARMSTDFRPGSVAALVDLIRQQVKGTVLEQAVTISGVPVLQAAVERGLRLSLFAGMLLGVITMSVLLLVALRRRGRLVLRILPLVAGVATACILAGLVTAVGQLVGNYRASVPPDNSFLQSLVATLSLALNPATLAALPIALGLAVDYAVQFLYRYTQGVERGVDDPWKGARRGAGRATRIAAVCTVGGLSALLLSTMPMVRQFGLVMSLGVGIAWVVARLTVLAAVKAWPWLGAPRSAAAKAPAEVASPPAGQAAPPAAAGQSYAAVATNRAPDVDEDVDFMLFGLGGGEAAATPQTAAGPAGAEVAPAEQADVGAQPVLPPPIPPPPPAPVAVPRWEPTPWDPGPEAIPDLGPQVAWSRAVLEPVPAVAAPPAPEAAPAFVAAASSGSHEVVESIPAEVVEDSASEPSEPSVESVSQAEVATSRTAGDQGGDTGHEAVEPGRIPALLAQFGRRHSAAILVPALLLAMVGWAALPFSSYESDPQKLVSPNLSAIRDLNLVRQATGSAGELDFILTGPDVTSQAAMDWSRNLQSVALRDSNGKLKPLASLSDLITQINGGTLPTSDKLKAYLAVTPTYFTNALVDPSHKFARIAFGINLAPIEEQKAIVDRILADVDAPPGYTYYPAGFNYLTIRGLESLQSGQLILNVVGAGLVLMLLLVIYRRRRMALMAWAPTLLVAGWSTAALFALRVPLTPMTAVLGALIVAFGTEFAILWLERYRDALAEGVEPGAKAAEAASRAAGPGIMLSGGALALGFVALAAGALPGISSLGFDLPVVRDFGLVATMDMVLAVAAALVVLPAIVIRFGLTEKVAATETTEGRVTPADAPA